MGISYAKICEIIRQAKISHGDISKNTGLSGDVIAKLAKDETMNMESLELIAKYISKTVGKKLQPGDLFEFKY